MVRKLPKIVVPFSRPPRAPGEDEAVFAALASGALSGGGDLTRKAHLLLEQITGSPKALVTGSGTAALEMACLLLDLAPGDEVIVPSFTFSSCANAIALRGAVPVFVDIRPDTFNIDEKLIEGAITSRTRAIMPVHYAGVAAEMDAIMTIARDHDLAVIEDAAQGVGARYRGRALGTIGSLGAFSFHGSKNISCGEGGALLVNDPALYERAEIIWEKGTNRSRFIRGEVDKYTWVDLGSSFLPSEVTAALLIQQLLHVEPITERRFKVWNRYHSAFAEPEAGSSFKRPHVPQDCDSNGHIYALVMPNVAARDAMLNGLKARGVMATFHYVPLHSSPAGQAFGRSHGTLAVTDFVSARLVRLPMYADLSEADQDHVIASVRNLMPQIQCLS